MYRKRNGNEYYDTNTYKTDSSGNEIYATLKNGSKIYLQIGGLDVMAKMKNSQGKMVPYFALDEFNHPICPRLEQNMMYLKLNVPYPSNAKSKQLYPKLNNKEYYIGTNQQCIYALDEYGEEYYAKNNNIEYYAFYKNANKEFVEYTRVNKNNENTYIKEENNFLYPFNLKTLQPIYPTDRNKNQYYLKLTNNKECFAVKNNTPFYAKDKNGNDILPYDFTGFTYYIFYILNEKKHEVYPKRDKDEYYLDYNYEEKYAKKAGDEYYATKKNKCNFFAKHYHIQFYAKTAKDVEIYPSDEHGNNFYKKIRNKEIIAKNLKYRQGFFAKDHNDNEIYPKSFENEKEESPPIVEIKKNYDFAEPTLNDIITHEASAK